MRSGSIKSKLSLLILSATIFVLILFLSQYLGRRINAANDQYNRIVAIEKQFSDLVLAEKDSLRDTKRYEELTNKFAVLRKSCEDYLIGEQDHFLIERQNILDELLQIEHESVHLDRNVRTILLDLVKSVRYIHEHHIAYLKNLMRRGVATQDYYTDEEFQRSSIKSASELDIIKVAVSIQASLLDIFVSFNEVQRNCCPANIRNEFSEKIKVFYYAINSFEDFSLDAQDGLLVEELLINGRTFEQSFNDLLVINEKKNGFKEELEKNRRGFGQTLARIRKNIEAKSKRHKRYIEIIQVGASLSTILLVCWIALHGKAIIREINRTVTETRKIEQDCAYQIEADSSPFDEFRIVFKVLNSMASSINDHIEKLSNARAELESRVEERTAELVIANDQLRREIDDRKQAEGELATVQALLLAAIEANPAGMLIADAPDVKIRIANSAALGIRGETAVPLTDIPATSHPKHWQVYHPDGTAYRAEDLPLSQAVLYGKTSRNTELLIRRQSGENRWVLANAAPVYDGKGKIIAGVAVFPDITDHKRAEKERMKLEIQLQRAQKMEAIGTLAGGVAHDLNNILSGLVSYPELLLLDLPDNSPLRKPLLTIQQSGEKAAVIVQDLLTLARRGVPTLETVNLNDVVEDLLKTPECNKLREFHPDVQIEVYLDEDLFNILGSPVHLSKSIMNLISNAAEAMPEGGQISIATVNQYVDLPIRGYDDVREGDYVVLSVTDSGVGISPQDIERIFEPFYTKKVMGRSGTGLGMAVVWGTVKDHNGYIDVQTTEGKGTRFDLYFPVTRQEPTDKGVPVPIDEYMGSERILVVDDVREQREIACQMLSKLGYSVTTLSSGEEALEYLKGNSADLVVLDMIMDPGIDGLETYKKILEHRPGQKAIIASGFSETDRVREAQSLGAGAYIKKPYVLEKIGLAVRAELDK